MNPAAGQAEAKRIDTDPGGFLAAQDDPEGRGDPITLPDGSVARRLPGYRRWIWDGEFAGVIGLRWQPGTADLPPHVLGTSATPSSPGNAGSDTPPPRCGYCYRRRGRSACPTSN